MMQINENDNNKKTIGNEKKDHKRCNINSLQDLQTNRLITDLALRYGKTDDYQGGMPIHYVEVGKFIAIYIEDYDKKEYRFRVYCHENETSNGRIVYERWMGTGSVCENADFKRLYESVEKENNRETIHIEEDPWYEDFANSIRSSDYDFPLYPSHR